VPEAVKNLVYVLWKKDPRDPLPFFQKAKVLQLIPSENEKFIQTNIFSQAIKHFILDCQR
jgi:hypothetical protein